MLRKNYGDQTQDVCAVRRDGSTVGGGTPNWGPDPSWGGGGGGGGGVGGVEIFTKMCKKIKSFA